MSGIVNKIKDALHHDKDHSSSTTHSTGTAGHPTSGGNTYTGAGTGIHGSSGSTNAGPHSSNLANKADPRIDSDLDNSRNAGAAGAGQTTTGAYNTSGGSTNAGPHSSNLANKADPRVDSDLSNTRHTGTGVGSGTTGYGNNTSGSTNQGPYSSNIANKLDPRVDSNNSNTTHGTGYGSSTTTGHSSTGYGTSGSTNHGPHDSNIANKLDPRIDSDRDGSRNAGAASGYSGTGVGNSHTHGGTTGGISSSTNAGPHDSNLANKVDPRVDSDLDSTGNRHGANTGGVFGASGSHATAGSGTAQNTAGPHNSDLLNKLDPRVDSDRDNSKTYGGNATHQ